ncbi:uncharacterized protein [Nicotiana tomentosiformis]|uniref:uncharacterized protein n=1 Tax=Nicotiana tomentosiformis TaxID=4098 RepID=UPI00388C372A
MARTMLIDSGVPKSFWAEAVNACYLINKCMIMSLLNKTLYELINERKPKLTYVRAFGCKCFVLNNGKEALGKFDAKSVEGGKDSHDKNDQDGKYSKVPGEVIDMANGKADPKSQVKESSGEDATEPPANSEEPGPSITITKMENRVVNVVQGTPNAERRSGTHTSMDANDGSHTAESGPLHPKIQVSNWKSKISYPPQNVITPLYSGIHIRSKLRNMFSLSAFLSQIKLKNIKEALKDADWITAMKEELHQFEKNSV